MRGRVHARQNKGENHKQRDADKRLDGLTLLILEFLGCPDGFAVAGSFTVRRPIVCLQGHDQNPPLVCATR